MAKPTKKITEKARETQGEPRRVMCLSPEWAPMAKEIMVSSPELLTAMAKQYEQLKMLEIDNERLKMLEIRLDPNEITRRGDRTPPPWAEPLLSLIPNERKPAARRKPKSKDRQNEAQALINELFPNGVDDPHVATTAVHIECNKHIGGKTDRFSYPTIRRALGRDSKD